MHENKKIKPKRGIEWSYRSWERKTLQKLRKKMAKNLSAALPSWGEREKVEKLFEKDVWNSQRTVFEKLETRCLIDRTCFSVNRTSNFRFFFKNSSLTVSNILFKKFFNFFSLSPTWQGCTQIFCRFLPQFLQGFPPSRPVRPFYPSFWFYFLVFMHFFIHFKGIFGPS